MSDRNMVYRNPYHGYSDNEYGYNNNNNDTTKGYQHQHTLSNGYGGQHNGGHGGGHYGHEDWTHGNGYKTNQVRIFSLSYPS